MFNTQNNYSVEKTAYPNGGNFNSSTVRHQNGGFQKSESPGAVTLERTLVKNSANAPYMEKQVASWVNAIKRGYTKSADGKEALTPEERNIVTWYSERLHTATYKAQNWKISPEKSLLFQKFRSDPWYHLKNLVEMVIREFVEADLKSQGYSDVRVWRTSDSDDVCAGVDLIVEFPKTKTDPADYFGIDIAVSSNKDYLDQKKARKYTECSEFNAYKGKRGMTMDREVYDFSPKTISYFLSSYMRAIMKGQTPNSQELLTMFDQAVTVSVPMVQNATKDAVSKLLH